VAVIAPSDSASIRNSRINYTDLQSMTPAERKLQLDEDNLTLAERHALLQQEKTSCRSQGVWPQPQGLIRTNDLLNTQFDSHQPKRTSGIDHNKREVMLANWRESLQQDLGFENKRRETEMSVQDRRNVMIAQRRQAQTMQNHQAAVREHMDTVFDTAMRRGELLDLHKEAIRKMQAAANQKA